VGEYAGMAVAFAALTGLTTALDVTWRSAFLVLGALAAVATAAAYRLSGPAPGRDIDGVRAAVTDGDAPAGPVESAPLGAFESTRRVLLVPTVRPLLAAYAALGLCGVPTVTYLLYFADERWHLGLGGQGLLLLGIAAIAIAALVRAAPAADRRFAASPAGVVRAAMLELGVGAAALVLGVNTPFLVVAMALITIGLVSLALVKPSLDIALLSLFPPSLRAHASGLAAASMWTAGGLGGVAVLSGIDRRFGPGGAVVVAALAGAQGVLALRAAARTIDADLDRLVDEIVDEVELQQLVAGGRHLPLLACRHVDFSYGQLQVLFDVDFTVDDGEMVALLGTNGAGKSTLLRVVSGLSLPSRGTVRLAGIDVTYVDAERRTRLGVSQVPGGRGVYGPLSVLENLRVLGYSRGRDQAPVNRGIEEAFDAFPRLAERRHQPASTLSGGEQQMLSLSRAFLVRPRLLLIDELSLGLAPKVVSELLTMVRRINAEGTAVVIVEQSVNVALSLVDHAYFMEKGEVRFDGVASELLARPDLLRSVFLQGATSNGEVRPR
jgi:ABC-type branched-subunit amino acid transport system ATPase component